MYLYSEFRFSVSLLLICLFRLVCRLLLMIRMVLVMDLFLFLILFLFMDFLFRVMVISVLLKSMVISLCGLVVIMLVFILMLV